MPRAARPILPDIEDLPEPPAKRRRAPKSKIEEPEALSPSYGHLRYYIRVLEGAYYVHLCRDGVPTSDITFRCSTPESASEKCREMNLKLGYPEDLA